MSIPIRPYKLHSFEVSNLTIKVKSQQDVSIIKIKKVAFLKLDKTFHTGYGSADKIKEFKKEIFQNKPCSSCQNITPNVNFCGNCGTKLIKPIDDIDIEILRYEIFDENGTILDKNQWNIETAKVEIIQNDYWPAYDMEDKYETYLNNNHGIDFVKFDPDRFITKSYPNPLKQAFKYEMAFEYKFLLIFSITLTLISLYFSYTWSDELFLLSIPLSLFSIWVIYELLKRISSTYFDYRKVNKKYKK